jgi:chromosomal replication initiator protein
VFSASSREAAALWAAAIDALSGRVSPRTRAALTASTAALELLPRALRVTVDPARLPAWIGGGTIALLAVSVARLTDGEQSLALCPVEAPAPLTRDPRLAFASFIASPANRAARDAMRSIARRDPSLPFALLLGPSGSGKSHLLRCAAAELSERLPTPSFSALGEQLVLDLIDALWQQALPALRSRLAGASALVIDGIESLRDRHATQEELGLAIDDALERGAPVLLSLRSSAVGRAELLPQLADRLARARTYTLEVPGWEARVALVLARLRPWGVRATPEVAALIASHLRADLEGLDATLTALIGASSGALDDPPLVEQLLAGSSRDADRPSPEHVIGLVAHHFDISPRDLRSSARTGRTSAPRQIAMYLLRRHCGLSYPEVGRQFQRHHTTALHSDRLVQRRIQSDPALRSAVNLLEKELRSGPERGR